ALASPPNASAIATASWRTFNSFRFETAAREREAKPSSNGKCKFRRALEIKLAHDDSHEQLKAKNPYSQIAKRAGVGNIFVGPRANRRAGKGTNAPDTGQRYGRVDLQFIPQL